MTAQKCKNKIWAEIFCIFECLLLKIHLIKALNSLDSSRPNGGLSQNSKTRGFRELFLPKNDSKTCSAVNFLKKYVDFGGQETNQRHEFLT